MKKGLSIASFILGTMAILAAGLGIYYKLTFPYGWSHCCIDNMMFSLEQYAGEHAGHYPTGGNSPEASLSLLYRSNYLDPYTVRGMTVPEKTVRTILEGGGLLGPDTCGWHYTDGLTRADDPRIALLYCKQPLGHNGEKMKDGGRQVVLVGSNIQWVSGDKWASFIKEQNELLSKRSDRAKAGMPLVDAIIELPDGHQVENVDNSYTLSDQESREDNFSSNGSSSGGPLNRDKIIWFNPPLRNNFSGFVTRTLSFSNLVSEPVTVTFTNGIPDKTNVVFRMHAK